MPEVQSCDCRQVGNDEMFDLGQSSRELRSVKSTRRGILVCFFVVFLIAFGIITKRIPVPF
jgi:hypothetical protein